VDFVFVQAWDVPERIIGRWEGGSVVMKRGHGGGGGFPPTLGRFVESAGFPGVPGTAVG